MSKLCWVAFYGVLKNTPTFCEQKWPKNRRHLSIGIQTSLLVVDLYFGSILCSHYSRLKMSRKPIRYDVMIQFQDQRSAASLRYKT